MIFSPTPLHLPDGFLSPLVAAVGWLLALVFISWSLRRTNKQLQQRQVPLMGILAAFIFAAQALNFPIVAGTSGHLLGGALAAVILGPWAASLVMTAVIVLQGFLFQDGGLLVMGWNIMNMGVMTSFVGYAGYRWARRLSPSNWGGIQVGAFAGAWLSVMVGAMATAVELAASDTFPLPLALPAMAGVHAMIGLGEGVITVATLSFLERVRPGIVVGTVASGERRQSQLAALGLLVALLVAMLAPLASTAPDGLEAVAERGGFADLAVGRWFELLPDYTIPLIANPVLATIAAVAVGTVIVFFIGLGLGRLTADGEAKA